MYTIGNLLVCGLLQVSLVAFFAIATTMIGSRWSRRWAASLSAWALIGIVGLTLLAMLPLPSWFDQKIWSDLSSREMRQTPTETQGAATISDSRTFNPNRQDETSSWMTFVNEGLDGIRDFNQVETSTSGSASIGPISIFPTRSQLISIFLWMFGIGLGIGLCRFLGGVLGVYFLVRSSRQVKDPRVTSCLEILQAQLRYKTPIEVRENSQIQSAAVVGWRKPVLLLSADWKQWNADQLQSVMAHEVAHISRDDYFINLLAQLSLVLHFYHPLVHWLVARMRLEQELAADALAANAVGGANVYLKAIGELALSQSKEHVAWPVQAFLPTRGTFLRRIEMLRGMGTISDRVPSAWRLGSLSVLVGVMLLAVGLRPSFDAVSVTVIPDAIVAGEPAPVVPVVEEAPFEAKFVPGDATAVIMLRMSKISQQYKQIAAKFPEMPANIEETPVVSKGCSEMTVILGDIEREGDLPQYALVMKLDSQANRDAAKKKLLRGSETKVERVLFADVEVAGKEAAYNVDEKTLIFGEADWVKQLVVTGPTSKSMLTRTDDWKKGVTGDILISFDPKMLFNGIPMQKAFGPAFALVSPLLSATHVDTIAIEVDQDVKLNWSILADDEAFPKLAEETFIGIKTSLSSMLESQQQRNANEEMSLALKIIKEAQIERKSAKLQVSLKSDNASLTRAIAVVVAPAIRASSRAKERAAFGNNMKYVMLALHSYHDSHGHFPPAIMIDKESGVARSWRVEILPYIEQQALYDAYRKNEPWDSEANKKVLAKMPVLYRHPSQPADSVNTSIFAAYGAGLMFEKKSGVSIGFRDITDGTSNTIAIIEAKRDIPWTKPEEIEFDVTAPKLPELGFAPEGYQVGFGDGSVRFIARSIDAALLFKFLTRAGGEVVQ